MQRHGAARIVAHEAIAGALEPLSAGDGKAVHGETIMSMREWASSPAAPASDVFSAAVLSNVQQVKVSDPDAALQ